MYGGVLTAPSRALSVGTTQGAVSANSSGIVFPTVDGARANWWVDVELTDVNPAVPESTSFSNAVTATRRYPLVRVAVDWDRDGYLSPYTDLSEAISSISVDRAAVGDLPPEVSLIEGSIVAEATLTLAGRVNGVDVFDLLAPYRSDSPFFRKSLVNAPVVIQLGFLLPEGPVYEPHLVGHIRSIKPDSVTRTVEVTVLDVADLLRAPITLPVHAMNQVENLGSRHKFYINSQAVIDYILRQNGIYASTAPHPEAQISCTGHGWLAAEVGLGSTPRGIAAAITEPTWWVPGPFDMLAVRGVFAANGPYEEFIAREPYTPGAGFGVGMAAWLRVGPDIGPDPNSGFHAFIMEPYASANTYLICFTIYGDGSLGGTIVANAGAYNDGGFSLITGGWAWRYMAVHFQQRADGTTRIRMRLEGNSADTIITPPTITAQLRDFPLLTSWMKVSWSNFHMWYDYNAPDETDPFAAWPGETPLDQADLDVGLNWMSALPDVVGRDSWELIREIAAAEYALCGFDETGRFTFTTRDTALRETSSTEDVLTADRSLLSLVAETSVDSVRNVVSSETTAQFLVQYKNIFAATTNFQFDTVPGTTWFEIDLPYGAVPYTDNFELLRVASTTWPDLKEGVGAYVPVDFYNPSTELPDPVDVTVTFIASGNRKGLLKIANNSGYKVRFATTSGDPALRVAGWLQGPDPAVVQYVVRQGSIATYGMRVLKLDANDWRQLSWAIRPVALRLATELSQPPPVVDQFEAIGNPARKIGDTLRLVDPDGQGTLRATLVKYTRSMDSSQGLRDTLTVRPVGPPGRLILGDPELGILGDPTLYIG